MAKRPYDALTGALPLVLTAPQRRRALTLVEKRIATVRVSLGDAPEAVLMRGGSAIINSLGQVLAGPHFGSETILTADLDLNDIGRGKFDFDVTGHYMRPDVFRLAVNTAPQPAVTWAAQPEDDAKDEPA